MKNSLLILYTRLFISQIRHECHCRRMFQHYYMNNVVAGGLASQRQLNPYMTNGFSHHCNLDESTFILGVLGVIIIFISFFDKISLCKQNSSSSAASHLGLWCLPMYHKKDARLK